MPEQGKKLRLNQAIAMTGLCSRRKADEFIAAGKVELNGAVCMDFNATVDQSIDKLKVNGKPLPFQQFAYIALHKPKGIVVSMSDERGRQTVIDLLPPDLKHLKPVGRLDRQSEGLLILTNDGNLALRLTHPRHHLPKIYRVKVKGDLPNPKVKRLQEGIPLEDGMTLPAEVQILRKNKDFTDLEITIFEGRNRQIRRMFEYLGYPVQRLVRLAIGGLQLGQMEPGSWRYLTSQEVSKLIRNSRTSD